MGTKVKIQPTKTKLKYDTKAGDKMNIDLQGYIKNKNLFTKDPLKGSKIKGRVQYKKGRHSVTGTASHRPGGESTVGAKYTLKFKKGGKIRHPNQLKNKRNPLQKFIEGVKKGPFYVPPAVKKLKEKRNRGKRRGIK